jgi:hypothetical protein
MSNQPVFGERPPVGSQALADYRYRGNCNKGLEAVNPPRRAAPRRPLPQPEATGCRLKRGQKPKITLKRCFMGTTIRVTTVTNDSFEPWYRLSNKNENENEIDNDNTKTSARK